MNQFNRNLVSELEKCDILEQSDVNNAYDCFLDIVTKTFDRSCPKLKHKKVRRNRNKPWMTNCLINACKKKNQLYKKCLKRRCKQTLLKYKLYKNKLVSILRVAGNTQRFHNCVWLIMLIN
jgi:hypothetical protein